MSNRVTTKGQVTIPKKIRDYLGIKPGAAVEFEPTKDGRVEIVAKKRKSGERPRSRFARLRGTATVKMSTRQIMALTRGSE
jgi:antitoxin PrlF